MSTIIAKNNTGSAIEIEDLGVEIPGSGFRNLTETFTKSEILESEDLSTEVSAGNITINDGTTDLSLADSIRHINFETEYEDVVQDQEIDSTAYIDHNLTDHLDVDISNPTNGFLLKFDEVSGKWYPAEEPITGGDTPPDSTAVVWINPEEGTPYFYDESLDGGEWLSIDRTVFSFGRAGGADGRYLESSGVNKTGYYYIHRPGKLSHIYFRAEKGEESKEIEVRVNQSSILTFNLVSLGYASILNLNVETGDELQVWVSNDKGNIDNCVCQIEVAWRYE